MKRLLDRLPPWARFTLRKQCYLIWWEHPGVPVVVRPGTTYLQKVICTRYPYRARRHARRVAQRCGWSVRAVTLMQRRGGQR